MSTPINTVWVVKSADASLLVNRKIRLHVSSKALSIASPVFEGMFKPIWFADSATTKKNNDGLPEIELPDDNAKAMLLLCNLIHFRMKDAEQPTSWDNFVDVAIHVDKYDLHEAVQCPLSRFYKELLGQDDSESTEETKRANFSQAVVSYVLQDAAAFTEATAKLVLEHSSSYRWFGYQDGLQVFPHDFLMMLEEKRNHLRTKFYHSVRRWLQDFFDLDPLSFRNEDWDHPPRDGNTNLDYWQTPHLLLSRRLLEWEVQPVSIFSLVQRLKISIAGGPGVISAARKPFHRMNYRIGEYVEELASNFTSLSSGLCMEDVRIGVIDMPIEENERFARLRLHDAPQI